MQINKERLWGHLSYLCEEIGARMTGTQADERSVEYITAHFKRCGVETEVQNYPCISWEHEGTELILIGAGEPRHRYWGGVQADDFIRKWQSPNKILTPQIAQIYKKWAHGDLESAKAMAAKDGWKEPK